MTRWLRQASRVFGRGAAGAPVLFQLKCRCGRVTEGVRSSRHQVLSCEACRQPLFILPASVYPEKKQRKPKSAPKRTTGKSAKAATAAPPSDSAPTSRRNRRRSREETVPAVPAPAIRERLAALAKQFYSPLRAVVALIVLFLAITCGWIWHQRALASAHNILIETIPPAREALDRHHLAEAAGYFERAAAAVDTLGRSDPEAQWIRQMQRETRTALNLAPHSLFEMIEEAIDMEENPGPLEWSEAFRFTYEGAWVIIDTSAVRPPEAGASTPDRVELPFTIRGQPVSLLVDLRPFRTVLIDAAPQRMIFAAQLADCHRTADPQPGWEIVLRGETAFLWSDARNLAAVGFPEDEGLRQTLTTQSRLLGLE